MKVEQYLYNEGTWTPPLPQTSKAQWVLNVGCSTAMRDHSQVLAAVFSHAEIVGCSTSGEIYKGEVYDNGLVVTAVEFTNTQIRTVSGNQKDYRDSMQIGAELAQQLPVTGLRSVLVISDGQIVNGSDLVTGIANHLPKDVFISGGLAGDGDRFQQTIVWHNQRIESGLVTLCGFYGQDLTIGYGSVGGWSTFGPDREITRAENNVLYELDGQPALDLYRRYLGEVANELPGAALRFPLNLTMPGETDSVVRTILNINEVEKSMTFAGNMPQGAKVKLMKASLEALVDGAQNAAISACASSNGIKPQLAILISCVGRRLVLGQRIFEELESVGEFIGDDCTMCGFYSYGEISPLKQTDKCRLHNQTMTITTLSENQP